MSSDANPIDEVEQWLEKVVLGLNLCPFAHQPHRKQRIKLQVSHSTDDESLLNEFDAALRELLQTEASELETTVIIVEKHLKRFDDYLDFIAYADHWLELNQLRGVLQLASFHPDYQFEGTDLDASENLTNRSPYPLLHIIREQSISEGLARYPFNHEQIVQQNIEAVSQLSEEQKRSLFPYLFKH